MTVIGGGRIATPGRLVEYGWVRVGGEAIAEVGLGEFPGKLDVDLDGRTLVPGFVDQHCHGGGGGSFITADPDEARLAADTHLAHGTTSVMASLVTATHADLIAQIETLAPLVDDGTIMGIHLEGPWISRRYHGAHDSALMRDPHPDEVADLLSRAGGRIRMVTLAPELDFALDAIRVITDSAAVAAVGHTDANYDETLEAIEAGARVATHLFNRMGPALHRDPGPVIALIADDRVTVEMICDGHHLHPAIVRQVFDEAGAGRVAMITDAMAAAGLGDGRYTFAGFQVDVSGGLPRIAGTDTIAGSSLTLDRALRYVLTNTSLDLADVTRALATTPARTLGLGDRGAIEAGKRADLVVIGADLAVERVMRRGAWIESELHPSG